MAAAGHPGEDARLYDAVRAVGAELCPALGIAIPVGKDSMSMRTVWRRAQDARDRAAVAHRHRVRAGDRRAPRAHAASFGATPARPCCVLVDLGRGKNRLGGSALAQVYGELGADAARSRRARARCAGFFAAMQALNDAG